MKIVWWVILIIVVAIAVYFIQRDVGLGPKQTEDSVLQTPNMGGNNNQFYSVIINNTNVTFNRTGIKQPYFCQYVALGGGGGGCAPWIPCSCQNIGDGGDNPCVFGALNMTINQTTTTFTDYCFDNMTLSEYSCGSNSTMLNIMYRCSNGCYKGVCL